MYIHLGLLPQPRIPHSLQACQVCTFPLQIGWQGQHQHLETHFVTISLSSQGGTSELEQSARDQPASNPSLNVANPPRNPQGSPNDIGPLLKHYPMMETACHSHLTLASISSHGVHPTGNYYQMLAERSSTIKLIRLIALQGVCC